MPTKRTTLDVLLPIKRGTGTPLRVQLVRELRRAIQERRFASGMQLPATRALADELGLSRGLVVEAYEQLIAEGYLIAQRGSATRVAHLRDSDASPDPSTRRHVKVTPHIRYDFRPGVPDMSLFPTRAWDRALREALNNLQFALDYPDPQGPETTRSALAKYLNRSRATVARTESVIMCTGFAQAARLIGETLFSRGLRQLGVENPGHAEQCADIRATGLELVPLPLDADGLSIEALARTSARAVLVTPSHQYPTGAILSGERRLALLEWARRTDSLVLEDDYDSEYRYDGEPMGALHGMSPERVVYLGSASKMLAPSLRQGWIVAPVNLIERIVRAKLSADRGSPSLEQLALGALIEAGDLDRHLRRTRDAYRRRREVLVVALRKAFPESNLRGVAAGLHVMLELPNGTDEELVVRSAAAQGIRVYGARQYYIDDAGATPALVLGYGSLPERDTNAAVRALAAIQGTSPFLPTGS